MISFIRQTFLVVLVVFFLTSCSHKITESNIDPIAKLSLMFLTPQHGVMVVAHRACWRLAPENSPASIKQCIKIGVDMVEIDVRRTKDGHLILMHDKSVDRTTNGSGLVKDLTLAEIRKLRLKEFDGGDNAALTSLKVPTLSEALLAAKGKILINLDAKGKIREQAFQEAKAINMLNHILLKNAMTGPTQVLKNSNYYQKSFFMPIIKEKHGDLATTIRRFDKEPQQAYEVIFTTERGIKQACKAAYDQKARCWVNTLWEELSPGYSDDRNVAEPDLHWGVLIKQFGVDMIQTDRPQLLIDYLEKQGL